MGAGADTSISRPQLPQNTAPGAFGDSQYGQKMLSGVAGPASARPHLPQKAAPAAFL